MMRTMSTTPKPSAAPLPVPRRDAALPDAAAPARWSSQALLGGRPQVEIEHNNAIYRLRVTSLGKLILTK